MVECVPNIYIYFAMLQSLTERTQKRKDSFATHDLVKNWGKNTMGCIRSQHGEVRTGKKQGQRSAGFFFSFFYFP